MLLEKESHSDWKEHHISSIRLILAYFILIYFLIIKDGKDEKHEKDHDICFIDFICIEFSSRLREKESKSKFQRCCTKRCVAYVTTTTTLGYRFTRLPCRYFLRTPAGKLQMDGCGTDQALKMGKDGDVDIVLCHAKK